MMQVKILFTLFAVLMLIVLGANNCDAADCLSGRYRGSCLVWNMKKCRDTCRHEGRTGGHCSTSLKCWCEGC
ncbi:drosomycin-like [Drosophila subpulchrella]|uniref:drosomycin-like n=1 Tax=Drosophila subpulchrella TaxID=1486046 RepID=UPI0018A14E1B|nr:drosomycin-like [Drosophila subpulchrella]